MLHVVLYNLRIFNNFAVALQFLVNIFEKPDRNQKQDV